ncbi:MAG: class I SAM-dependent methyltransferase [bacterium]|nr:class I SAM-dependent methyltransferase [bacterium]
MRYSPTFALGQPANRGWFILERRWNLMRLFLPHTDWGSVLDVGCGNGAQTAYLLKQSSFVTAIDLSLENIQIAKQLLPSVDVQYGSAEKIPFSDSTFDLITCFEVLEHVTNDQKAMLEMKRVLKDQGKIILTVPNKWWIFETHGCKSQGLLKKVPWNRIPYLVSWLPTSIHEKVANARIYSKRRIIQLVQSVGLKVDQHVYVTATMDVIRWTFLQKCLRQTIFRNDYTHCPLLAISHFLVLSKTK